MAFSPAINVFLCDDTAPDDDPGLLSVVDLSLLLNAHDVAHLCGADVLLELPFSDFGNPLLFAAHHDCQSAGSQRRTGWKMPYVAQKLCWSSMIFIVSSNVRSSTR